jgi:hypothetical protein
MSNGERRLKNVEVDKSKKSGLEHIPILILDTKNLGTLPAYRRLVLRT